MNKKFITLIVILIILLILISMGIFSFLNPDIFKTEYGAFDKDIGKIVTYSGQAKDAVDGLITGQAKDAANGAILEIRGVVLADIFIEGLNSWPKDFQGKSVIVTGKLVYKNISGYKRLVFEQASWKLDNKEQGKNNLWGDLNNTTWKKETSFTDESYVFFENDNGQKKCIHQIYGSGVYVVFSEFKEINIITGSMIKLDGEVFEYKANKLISNTSTLELYKKEPIIYNKNGVVDMKIIKKNNFDIKELDNF